MQWNGIGGNYSDRHGRPMAATARTGLGRTWHRQGEEARKMRRLTRGALQSITQMGVSTPLFPARVGAPTPAARPSQALGNNEYLAEQDVAVL